jgi:hypothetical protein
MFQRTFLNRAICITAALAVVVAVWSSPVRPLRMFGSSAHPNYLRRNFAIPPTHAARHCVKSVMVRGAMAKAVRSESEAETLGKAVSRAQSSLNPPPSAHLKTAIRDLAIHGLPPSPPPLRC